jgi:hypothetical protein
MSLISSLIAGCGMAAQNKLVHKIPAPAIYDRMLKSRTISEKRRPNGAAMLSLFAGEDCHIKDTCSLITVIRFYEFNWDAQNHRPSSPQSP